MQLFVTKKYQKQKNVNKKTKGNKTKATKRPKRHNEFIFLAIFHSLISHSSINCHVCESYCLVSLLVWSPPFHIVHVPWWMLLMHNEDEKTRQRQSMLVHYSQSLIYDRIIIYTWFLPRIEKVCVVT